MIGHGRKVVEFRRQWGGFKQACLNSQWDIRNFEIVRGIGSQEVVFGGY
jgi:hypothetical protein